MVSPFSSRPARHLRLSLVSSLLCGALLWVSVPVGADYAREVIAQDQDTAKPNASSSVLPARMEVKPLASTQPGTLRFSVSFVSLHREQPVRITVINPERPFRFSIIDNATGELVNNEDFPTIIFENEEVRWGEVTLAPGGSTSFEVVYPRGEARLPKGSYEVGAIMSVWEFWVGEQHTKLADLTKLRSNEVDFQVKANAPTTVLPASIADPVKSAFPAQTDGDKLPLALETLAQLPREVRVGALAPDFDVQDMNGTAQRLSDYQNKKRLLLTFFPKCFTGGCINHLSSLRDVYPQLQAADVEVLAVSVDPAEGEKGQKEFARQWKLPFPLIPDTQRKLSMLYGAAQTPDQLTARMSVLIDKQGIVRFVDTNVNVQTRGADVLVKVRELSLGK